ncbi:YaiI/YqxD family protein [Shouchella shacheensis]|uniref:YaiI/YqxD family protein n=1 Tax=Shouchella shacheensis TaxID=1649580 RepID=UPI0007401C16|nr:DUF188 domain-containing protein [Shouchella shacheensis]
MTKRNQSFIYVDADSCPVKEEIIALGREYEQRMVFVFSYAHMMELPKDVRMAIVDSDKEAVDLHILRSIKAGDVCITQDHALASVLVAKQIDTLSPKGLVYKDQEMMAMLESRYLSQKARRAGRKTAGPKRYTKSDREAFSLALARILEGKQAGLGQYEGERE